MTGTANVGFPETIGVGPPKTTWDVERWMASSKAMRMRELVLAAMKRRGFGDRDLFGVRLALEEAIVNAIKHGNGGDPTKSIRLAYCVSRQQLLVEIEDEGDGFDLQSVPDPLDPENLERPCGRGLLLMRTYMTWVRHHGRRNRVTMCKRRTVE
jgi:serine/threonine-protein kinase RsbW